MTTSCPLSMSHPCNIGNALPSLPSFSDEPWYQVVSAYSLPGPLPAWRRRQWPGVMRHEPGNRHVAGVHELTAAPSQEEEGEEGRQAGLGTDRHSKNRDVFALLPFPHPTPPPHPPCPSPPLLSPLSFFFSVHLPLPVSLPFSNLPSLPQTSSISSSVVD